MKRRGSSLGLAALLFVACGSGDRITEAGSDDRRLDRGTFVDVYVELRRAEEEAGTPGAFETRRKEILARYHTTPEALIEFVEARAHDVRYMAEVWDSIDARLSARERDQRR